MKNQHAVNLLKRSRQIEQADGIEAAVRFIKDELAKYMTQGIANEYELSDYTKGIQKHVSAVLGRKLHRLEGAIRRNLDIKI
jgi:hypothetical protein